MILQLDPDSPVPPYEQLRSQITTMVATGVLPQGARLPPIRQLARDLGVATATIARVFRELERDQAAAAHSFAVQARQLGIDPEQALHQARQALEALVPRAGHA
jgi:DNA-binding transcriptional regulator YhcF (GntR family)